MNRIFNIKKQRNNSFRIWNIRIIGIDVQSQRSGDWESDKSTELDCDHSLDYYHAFREFSSQRQRFRGWFECLFFLFYFKLIFILIFCNEFQTYVYFSYENIIRCICKIHLNFICKIPTIHFFCYKKKILLDVFAKFYLYLFKLHIQLRRNSLDNLKKVWHEYFKCLAKPS